MDISTTDTLSQKKRSLLLFVIHGMGTQTHLSKNVANLEKNLLSINLESSSQFFESITAIPVEYYSKLHSLPSTDERGNNIRLDTCPSLRFAIFNFSADPLYYFTPFHGLIIRELVTKQINEKYDEYLSQNPEDNPIVSILAHSMGGLIVWDILNETPVDGVPLPAEKLKPPISQVFLAGSPVSKTLVLRGHEIAQYRHSARFYNIYHPTDPVAYRLEPIFDGKLKSLPPVNLPRYFKPPTDLQRKIIQIQKWVASSRKRKRSESPQHKLPSHHKSKKHHSTTFPKTLSWNSLKEAISSKFILTSEISITDIFKRFETNGLLSSNSFSSTTTSSHTSTHPTTDNLNSLISLLPYRMDYCLPQNSSSFGVASYFNAIFSHFIYWDNIDFASFIINTLNLTDCSDCATPSPSSDEISLKEAEA